MIGNGRCAALEPYDNCPGTAFCMHHCFDRISDESMRVAVQFQHTIVCPPSWRNKITTVLDHKMHPHALARCGITASLLAFCGITLRDLLRYGYHLEHLIRALEFTFNDLLLLGFRLHMLVESEVFPLIVLYDLCSFRADTLFSLDIGFQDLRRFVLDVNPLYARLLDLNVPWWRHALQPKRIVK